MGQQAWNGDTTLNGAPRINATPGNAPSHTTDGMNINGTAGYAANKGVCRHVRQQQPQSPPPFGEERIDGHGLAEQFRRAQPVAVDVVAGQLAETLHGGLGQAGDADGIAELVHRIADALLQRAMHSHEVLDLTRIEAGRIDLDTAPFSIEDVLEGCVETLAARFAQQVATLKRHRELL